VIARIWRGWTTPENADAYQQVVSQEVLPGIAARNLDGYHGAYLLATAHGLRRPARERVAPCCAVRCAWFTGQGTAAPARPG
jgi:hypothetical protein